MHARTRSDDLLVEEVGSETVVYDTESGQAHCLAPVAAAVFAHCDGKNSVDDLARLAASELGEPVDARTVDAALAQLEERSLLAPRPSLTPTEGFSRRSFVRKTAATTAAVTAAPMITSIVTPAFGQANGSPQPICPGSKCASGQTTGGKGQEYCGCINTCPPFGSHGNVSNCQPFDGQDAPFYDSCECHQCPRTDSFDDQGEWSNVALGIATCEAEYGENYWVVPGGDPTEPDDWNPNWVQQCTQADVDANMRFGCESTSDDLDGVCFCEPGDSSFDCFCET